MNAAGGRRRHVAMLWSVLAFAFSIGALFFVFRDVDLDRLSGVVLNTDPVWIIVLALSIPLEQVLRGWKWRQILFDIRPVDTLRLFGAVMAGYFANLVVPVGISPLVRAWLVARLEKMRLSTVLMTTAIERFVDGMVFAVLVGVLFVFAGRSNLDMTGLDMTGLDMTGLDSSGVEGDLRLGLMVAATGSLALFSALMAGLFIVRRRLENPASFVGRAVARLEKAFGGRLAGLGEGISTGILWPASPWRGLGVVGASLFMKLIATTHFLWAGLAFGIVLAPFDYLFIMILSGFALIITRFIRLPGGGLIGAAFALKLLHIADEEALTMVLAVHAAATAMTLVLGALALWKGGLKILDLKRGLMVREA